MGQKSASSFISSHVLTINYKTILFDYKRIIKEMFLMKGTGIFIINGKRLELPLFEKGDRVKPTESSTVAIGATGTVESTREGGLFIDVKWDKEKYPSKTGGQVELGEGRMVNGLILLKE